MSAESAMHEVDPTPLEEAEAIENLDNEKLTSRKSSPSSGLGLSQHSPAYYLAAIQRYSSYVFSAFAAMHITNTSIIPLITLNVPASEPYLLLTRPYYQSPLAEPLIVVAPLYAHVLSGIALRIYRRNQNAKRFGSAYSAENKKSFFTKFWPHLSIISKTGYQLFPLIFGHMVVNRGIPRMYGVANVGLDYVSHAFARHSAVSFAGFAALLGIACFHIVWGWAKWLGFAPTQVAGMGAEWDLKRKRRSYIITAIAASTTMLWAAGSFGVIAKGGAVPGWVGRQYDDMYKMIPLVGRWMSD